MAKYRATFTDERTVDVYAPDEAGAKAQADHHDRERFIIAVKRGRAPGPSPSQAVSVVKLKD